MTVGFGRKFSILNSAIQISGAVSAQQPRDRLNRIKLRASIADVFDSALQGDMLSN